MKEEKRFARESRKTKAQTSGTDAGQQVLARAHGEAGRHGEEDEADVARLPDVAAEAEDRERGEHAEGGREVAHDDEDHERDDGAEDEQGVHVVLRIARAAVGALVGPGDERVEQEAEDDREQDLGRRGRRRGRSGQELREQVGFGRGRRGETGGEGQDHFKKGGQGSRPAGRYLRNIC